MGKHKKVKTFINVNNSCIIRANEKCIKCCQFIRVKEKCLNNKNLCQKCNRQLSEDEINNSIVSNITKQFLNTLNTKQHEPLYSQSTHQPNTSISNELHHETSDNIDIDSSETQSVEESIEANNETTIDPLSNSDNITLNQIAETDDFTEENLVSNCLYCVNCK